MTSAIDYALIGDGASDNALAPLIAWALRKLMPDRSFAMQGFIARRASPFGEVIAKAVQRYRPALLFVHRDAETVEAARRREEIPTQHGVVKVVPVRMTEAWLLIDENAIRLAAGNPHGKHPLGLPRVKQLDQLPDPKKTLNELLLEASGAVGPRRRARFNRERAAMVYRVSECIQDFSVLMKLEAFETFWNDLQLALEREGPQASS